MRWVAGIALAAALAAGAGCGGPGTVKSVSRTPPRPVDRVDRIDLWLVPPAAVNWDDEPGPDGVLAQVFFGQVERPEPVLVKGAVDFLLFEGKVQRADVATKQPFHTWTFTPQELATRLVRSMVGWGYRVELGWGKRVPASPAITLAARYQPKEGPPVYSSPVAIPMPTSGPSAPVKQIGPTP